MSNLKSQLTLHLRQAQSAPSEFFKVNFLGTRCGFPLRRSYFIFLIVSNDKS